MRIDNEEDITITLFVNECTNGIYLRWINSFGEWCYYLFNTGIKSNVIKNSDVNIVNLLRSVDYSDNYHRGTNYSLTKSGQKSIKLCVPFVDEENYHFFESLLESVYIDMFTGYNNDVSQWIRVNISDGTFARDKSHLQDFECVLILPQTQNQTL